MSIVTKWVVLQSHDVTPDDLDASGHVRDDVVVGWLERAREEYLGCCDVLRERSTTAGDALRYELRDVPASVELAGATAVSVSAGTTEFWPDAFTLAIRVRGFGPDCDTTHDLTCRVALVDPATGEARELGDDVRDELIALAHAAQHYN